MEPHIILIEGITLGMCEWSKVLCRTRCYGAFHAEILSGKRVTKEETSTTAAAYESVEPGFERYMRLIPPTI
jgi:hypothetical protein